MFGTAIYINVTDKLKIKYPLGGVIYLDELQFKRNEKNTGTSSLHRVSI